ncbi:MULTISPECIES: CopG family transcriptional regulator [unclassified Microcoleus]|uniref:ribbon-helix-helix domain-containing protein n=1 Tax=unclassified Microcoleus TaxID=2642155 RepID=UPI002FD6ACCF
MTTSFFRYVKPWLQYQPQFDEPDNLHLVNLYDYWSLFWAADTKTTSDLPYWEYEIRDSSMSYIRQGLALHAIRLKLSSASKNWRVDFENFCKNSPVGSSSYAKKIIQAASVAIDLINQGFSKIPSCISQALPLAKFCSSLTTKVGDITPSDTELSQKWQEVLDSAPEGRITTAHVKAVTDDEPQEKPTTIKIKKFKQNLAEEARERGISQQQLIEEILAERYLERSDEQVESEDCLEGRSDEQVESEEEYTPEQQAVLDDLDVVFEGSVRSGIRSDRVSDSS